MPNCCYGQFFCKESFKAAFLQIFNLEDLFVNPWSFVHNDKLSFLTIFFAKGCSRHLCSNCHSRRLVCKSLVICSILKIVIVDNCMQILSIIVLHNFLQRVLRYLCCKFSIRTTCLKIVDHLIKFCKLPLRLIFCKYCWLSFQPTFFYKESFWPLLCKFLFWPLFSKLSFQATCLQIVVLDLFFANTVIMNNFCFWQILVLDKVFVNCHYGSFFLKTLQIVAPIIFFQIANLIWTIVLQIFLSSRRYNSWYRTHQFWEFTKLDIRSENFSMVWCVNKS